MNSPDIRPDADAPPPSTPPAAHVDAELAELASLLRAQAHTGTAQTRAQNPLDLVAHALGWTSVERARHTATGAQAFARGATAAARGAFLERLAGWTTAALERSPGPIESARLSALAQVAALVREA